jgi:hypothetical protein
MTKPLSTFERKMKNPKFKKAFEEGYKKLLFSELCALVTSAPPSGPFLSLATTMSLI